MTRWRSAAWRWPVTVGGVLAVAGLLWVVLVLAPPWFVHDGSLAGLTVQNQVRTTLLQGLGGVALLLGAYFTWRQLRIAREGQITERFTRAIDQLGHDHLDVRLGGIYALERIARDSPADRATIGEVLTAFVRSHTPWPPSLPDQPPATTPPEEVPKLQLRAPDVQASLWVLGRGQFAKALGTDQWLDLSAADLRHADLRNACLVNADLRSAGLQRAFLGGARLEGAHLTGSHLERARLQGARLERANLTSTHLEGAEANAHTCWPDQFDWHAAGVTVTR
jgi:Pentapeptide repeats (8 copies)